MSMDLDSLYASYVRYLEQLRQDFDRRASPELAARRGAKTMSRNEFEQAWRRWGETPGCQEEWGRQFELGYPHFASRLRADLERALSGLDRQPSEVDREAA